MRLTYKILLYLATPLLLAYLQFRAFKGKEVKARLKEKTGTATLKRPQGNLIWIHAASVGEAQSALLLITKLSLKNPDYSFLVTSVTVTSSKILRTNLPAHAIHQFVPIDHPIWVKRFLNYWHPDMAIFMESEIWPNIIEQLKNRKIPSLIVNARLSEKSFKSWSRIKETAEEIFSTFDLILTQTKTDTDHFKKFGANAKTSGNIKLNAKELPVDIEDLKTFQTAIEGRSVWLYASTHAGEEELAAQTHVTLRKSFPNLLTIIVPRHPVRSGVIKEKLTAMGVTVTTRDKEKNLPRKDTDIYLANTLGELGLFYRAAPISMIGRSFSNDGGGGHNPIEAAQLGSIVLTGPNIQFQKNLFNPMFLEGAAIQVKKKPDLAKTISLFLTDENALLETRKNTQSFIKTIDSIIDNVITDILKHIPQKSGEPR